MACLRFSRFIFFFSFFAAFVVLFGGACLTGAFGQEPGKKTTPSPSSEKSGETKRRERDGNGAYLRDDLQWNWNQRGRTVPGESAAGLRFRAYRQKMAMRASRLAANALSAHATASSSTDPLIAKDAMSGAPALALNSTAWVALGPAPLASDATGDGGQDYNWVSGRATSVLIDPADSTGNTVLLGGAYGGLWKSTNAGSQNSNPALVTWQALIDDQPTLAVGAIALQPGNSSVILVGTGETNSSGDSYYGLGILRSADSGSTWTQIQSAGTGQSFLGIGFSKMVFSTANPNLAVAATAGDNGLYVGREEDGNSTARGLYFSQDGGVNWNRVILSDGAVPGSATAVAYNPSQAGGTFYAFIRRHGLYSSTDGQHFTRLTTQPTAGLASGLCPAGSNSSGCLIYRGEFAVVPGRNEMYVWVVDVQPDAYENPAAVDEGIWRSTNGGASWTQIPDNGITNCGDDAFGPDSGCGVEQGWYNLELAAIPDATGTDVYAGAINLYKCTLEGGTTCTQGDWINLTHVYGCNPGPLGAPAHVHPDQHGMAFMVASGKAPGYFAHDGGISRTLDGYAGLNTGSCSGTNQFDSLSQTLGSMTEFVSVSVHPTSADILLGGTQDNGSPKTSTATSSSTWQNALGGDGGFNAINPANPEEWFASNPYVTILKCESGSACDDAGFFEVVGSNDLGGDQGAFYTPYILDPQNTSEMVVGTCRVWWISTSGTAPLQLSDDFETLGTGVCTGDEINLVNALAAGGRADAKGNSEVVYAVTNGYGPLSGSPGGEVWVTTNAGVTLMTNVTQNATQNVNPQGYAISSVAMDSSDGTGNTAYVGIMGFSVLPSYPTSHVWKTASAGASWNDWSGTGATELPDAPVNAVLVDSQAGLVYAGTDVGVFVSSTSAPSWTEVGPAPGLGASGFLPNAPVTALQLFNYAGTKTLVASTYGRGIWNYALVTGPDFAIAVTATPNTTAVNQNVTWNGTLTAVNGYSGSVTLTCTAGDPAMCITPAPVTPTAGGAPFAVTLGSATAGTFNFTIQGTDGTRTHATPTETLTVTGAADFTIAVTAIPNTTAVNQNVTWNGTLTAVNGYNGSVTLTCTAGDPATCIISPPTVTPTAVGAPYTVTLGSATAGTFNFTIQGTDGTLTHATPTETLTVTGAAADFTWTDTGSTAVTVLAGQGATYAFVAAPVGGGTFSSAVNLTCAGLPALTTGGPGASCGFSPAAIAAGAGTTTVTLTIATAGPNLGTESRSRRGVVLRTAWTAEGGRPYAFILMVVMGIVGMGRKRCGKPRLYTGIAATGLGIGMMALISCGGVAGSGSTAPPVTVNPPTGTVLFADEPGNSWPAAVIQGSNQQLFTANQSVTWAITGGGANGTIDGTGMYTPPAAVPNPATVTVTATPATGAAPGSAFLTVAAPTVLGPSQITVTATAAGGAAHGDVVTLTVQ
jgi:hypothetical protein